MCPCRRRREKELRGGEEWETHIRQYCPGVEHGWPRAQHCVKTHCPPVLPTWRAGSKGAAPRSTLRVLLPLPEEGKEETGIPDMKTQHQGHRALDHAEALVLGACGCHCNPSGTASTGKERTRCRRDTSSNRNGTRPGLHIATQTLPLA